MVLSFFRRGESGMEHVTAQVVSMLGDARHAFDAATTAVLAGVDPELVAADIRDTDERINRAELALRRELVVHVAVNGASDIGEVLGYTLLIKKVERIGDQAKNIFDLALEGVSLAGAPDVGEFVESQRAISTLFGDVAALLSDPDPDALAELKARADRMRVAEEAHIRELVHSPEPGHWAVPRAILHRYLKRIVANLAGIALMVGEPVPLHIGDDTED